MRAATRVSGEPALRASSSVTVATATRVSGEPALRASSSVTVATFVSGGARTGRRIYAASVRLVLVSSFVLLASCGASAPPVGVPRTAHAEPLPASENQQGAIAALASLASGDDLASLPAVAPIPGVYLWCAAPTGRACRAASAALGTGPKETSGLPPALLTVEDLSDDCLEPVITAVSRRLAPALAVSPTGWRDQSGTYLESSLLSDMYSAAGCINDVDQSMPVAKISAGSGSSPRVYLVRVWDQGESTY